MRERVVLFASFVICLSGSCATATESGTQPHAAVERAGLVFPLESPPTPGCHASTIVETRDGKILAAWFAGADEGEDDVGIWVSRWENGPGRGRWRSSTA
jgi:hypothetical protein